MHRALSARWLNRALSIGEASASSSVPLFLCPAAVGATRHIRTPRVAPTSRLCSRRFNHTEAATQDAPAAEVEVPPKPAPAEPQRRLPLTCTGCGAFSQTVDSQQQGYFDLNSKRVKRWLDPEAYKPKRKTSKEDGIVDDVLKTMDESQLEALGLNPSLLMSGTETEGNVAPKAPPPDKQPVCDRCHNLQHYSHIPEVTMYHPTVESLRETIEESPHKYHHIYHVIDAADFPMSLIPRLNVLLGDIPIRTRNRRSRAGKYQKDRQVELSFIITRGDLLGPTKEIVDSMMPYLRETLRDALGRLGSRVRLGNVKCVSARRGWWTKELREDIWRRGGAGWMVGKVNVGKSQLFEAVFPKGRMDWGRNAERASVSTFQDVGAESIAADQGDPWKNVEVGDLLPPAQPATNYPDMPMVSSLPGTTTSPIRVPFGNGKGELVDLPGLARSDLEQFVNEEWRRGMVMEKRIVPEQVPLKPGQSLILGGGLIRITPKTPNMVFLAYNFTPFQEHVTATFKAVEFQEGTREAPNQAPSIMLPGTGDKMRHAGTFRLSYDVTKHRAGPLTRKRAVGLAVDQLPFRVLSTDILIEGVGYVELVAQVRAQAIPVPKMPAPLPEPKRKEREPPKPKGEFADPFAALAAKRRGIHQEVVKQKPKQPQPQPQLQFPPEQEEDASNWPAVVDVYSPEGRFVSSRRPLNGWVNNKPRVLAKHKKSRPRRSMKGQKKKDKAERRGAE